MTISIFIHFNINSKAVAGCENVSKHVKFARAARYRPCTSSAFGTWRLNLWIFQDTRYEDSRTQPGTGGWRPVCDRCVSSNLAAITRHKLNMNSIFRDQLRFGINLHASSGNMQTDIFVCQTVDISRVTWRISSPAPSKWCVSYRSPRVSRVEKTWFYRCTTPSWTYWKYVFFQFFPCHTPCPAVEISLRTLPWYKKIAAWADILSLGISKVVLTQRGKTVQGGTQFTH